MLHYQECFATDSVFVLQENEQASPSNKSKVCATFFPPSAKGTISNL